MSSSKSCISTISSRFAVWEGICWNRAGAARKALLTVSALTGRPCWVATYATPAESPNASVVTCTPSVRCG